jgi:hypothetical protein
MQTSCASIAVSSLVQSLLAFVRHKSKATTTPLSLVQSRPADHGSHNGDDDANHSRDLHDRPHQAGAGPHGFDRKSTAFISEWSDFPLSAMQVSDNRRRLRDLTNEVLRTLVDLANLTRGHDGTFETPALLTALGNVKG